MRVIVAIGGLLAATSLAWAADLPSAPMPQPVYTPAPPPPVYNWSGFYLGANVGYGFTNGSGTVTVALPPGCRLLPTRAEMLTARSPADKIGYNYQTGAFVVGAEADIQWSGQSTSTSVSLRCRDVRSLKPRASIGSQRCAQELEARSIVFWVYGTGGLAIIGVSDKLNANGFGATVNIVSLSDTAIGFTRAPVSSTRSQIIFWREWNISTCRPTRKRPVISDSSAESERKLDCQRQYRPCGSRL